MTLDAEGDPLRSAHREILEEEQTKVDHIVDVLSICHYIVTIRRESITRGGVSRRHSIDGHSIGNSR